MKGNDIESESSSRLPTKNVNILPEHAGIGLEKLKFI